MDHLNNNITVIGPMDNPTYDKGNSVAPSATDKDHEEDFQLQNPLYFDISPHQPNSTNPHTNGVHMRVSSNSNVAGETVYENPITNAHKDHSTTVGRGDSGGQNEEIAEAAPYEVPQTFIHADNSNCYSALGLTDYATLEPHIAEPKQQQLFPDSNEYSQLQH